MPFIRHIPINLSCSDPEHNTPTGIVLEPGGHVYQCPACGETQIINVPLVTC